MKFTSKTRWIHHWLQINDFMVDLGLKVIMKAHYSELTIEIIGAESDIEAAVALWNESHNKYDQL